MSRERLIHLSPKDVRAIESWGKVLNPLKEKYPILNRVNLVVEGGVGTKITMAHLTLRFFPGALYVGTDLAQAIIDGKPKQVSKVDDQILQRVVYGNEHPDFTMEDAIIYANCFDESLVHDLMRKTGRAIPLLISDDAVPALFDRKANPWERKSEGDLVGMEDALSGRMPYIGQLHITAIDWKEEGPMDRIEQRYYELEEEARKAGYITEKFDLGLLIIRSSFPSTFRAE